MRAASIRKWMLIHTWTSLISTIFLLIICVTGLPLILHDEIEGIFEHQPVFKPLPDTAPRVSLDEIVATARQLHPRNIILAVSPQMDKPSVYVALAPSWGAVVKSPGSVRGLTFDARTGEMLKDHSSPDQQEASAIETFLEIMRRLHVDMYARLSGQLFLAVMGLVFFLAIVSGAVLYAPFARKFGFGAMRTNGSRRIKWLDIHNLLGIVMLVWVSVVGLTGVINNLATPMKNIWQATEVNQRLQKWRTTEPLQDTEFKSLQAVIDEVERAYPRMRVTTAAFPGNRVTGGPHYVLGAKGRTKLTSFLNTNILVDARTGAILDAIEMPWYLQMLALSRPLHFGNYGELPLKVLWTLLDVMTIVVLVSGLYLWFARRKLQAKRVAQLSATAGERA